MLWLYSLAQRYRGNGWFQNSRTGALFPFPFSWQAWLLTGAYVAALAFCVLLRRDVAVTVCTTLTVCYIVFGYWTFDGSD
ncbi:MAG: hypothetical protein ABIS14_12460 [Sphingomonas sp.]